MLYRLTTLTTALAALALPAMAEGLTAEQLVEKRILVTDETGAETESFVPADMVAPGDTVRYVLAYENDGAEAAEAVVLTMPVPDETDFLEGSVMSGGARISYSYDEGLSFIDAPAPAEGENPTHVRWTFEDPIPGAATGAVSFQAKLN